MIRWIARRAIIVTLLIGVAMVALLFWPDSEPVSTASVSDIAERLEALNDPGALSARVIPESDLPPEGSRSLFDHMLKENGGLPYPFERLIDLVASYDRDGQRPRVVLIPDGRSLLKGDADFLKPRLVVASEARPANSDHDLGTKLKGRLFLGFVENADEIEVISYNEVAGRFEFQLVKDYREGATPKIVYARRAICTTCHQGRAPIFPVRPWQETNGQPEISSRIVAERGNKEAYFGAKLVEKLAAPEAVDDQTNLGNIIPTTQKIWLDGCGEGAEGLSCRRNMLKSALSYLVDPGNFSETSDLSLKLRQAQSQSWPKAGIAQADGDLLNRDPVAEAQMREHWLAKLRSTVRGWFASPTATVGNGDLDAFEALPPLRAELDPLTIRAPQAVHSQDSLAGVYGVAQMFSSNDVRLLQKHSNYDVGQLMAAADATNLDAWLGEVPFQRAGVTKALLESLGVEPLPSACCLSVEGMSAPKAQGVKPLAISEGSVLKDYEIYCFGCHRGNPAARLNFMDGDKEEEVLALIEETSSIKDALDYDRYIGTSKEGTLMPPPTSWQRRKLDEAGAEGEAARQRMMEAVPDLFEF